MGVYYHFAKDELDSSGQERHQLIGRAVDESAIW